MKWMSSARVDNFSITTQTRAWVQFDFEIAASIYLGAQGTFNPDWSRVCVMHIRINPGLKVLCAPK